MNRCILKITIINNNYAGLKIEIIKWENDFIYDSKKIIVCPFVTFESTNEFVMYSYGNGEIFDNTFVVPEKDKLKKNHVIYKDFDSDDRRYNFLKNFRKCLLEWNKNWIGFRNEDKSQINNYLLVRGKYWFI
jgi:hypothetical protein